MMRIIFVTAVENSGGSAGERLSIGSDRRNSRFEKQKEAIVKTLLCENLVPRRGWLQRTFGQSVSNVSIYYPQPDPYSKGWMKDLSNRIGKAFNVGQDGIASRFGLNGVRTNPFVLGDVSSVSPRVDTVICVASVEAVQDNLRHIAGGFQCDEYAVSDDLRYGSAVVVDLSLPGNLKWHCVADVLRGDGGRERIEERAAKNVDAEKTARSAALLEAEKAGDFDVEIPPVDTSVERFKCTLRQNVIECF